MNNDDSPFFPLQQSIELFQISSSSPILEHQRDQEDMFFLTPSLEGNEVSNPINPVDKTRRRKSSSSSVALKDDEENSNDNKKKIMHREVERQRRQEMSSLYASLRSLLPYQYLKGKRSICDHMNQATNYIKDLQKRIQELSEKRDVMKRSSPHLSADVVNSGGSSRSCSPDCVIVRPCWGGVEVVINSGLDEEGMPFSRILEQLVEEGLDVSSCISTKVNQSWQHSIRSEVINLASLDLARLQQKLADLVEFLN